MKIAIASDHAGFLLKSHLIKHLSSRNFNVLDMGTDSQEAVDYPDFAQAIGEAIAIKAADKAILICGSGVGASIAANKIAGVRAAICHDNYSAHQGVEHDDMNVLVLGSRIIGDNLAIELVETFLAASFSQEERHLRRLNKVLELERHESSKPSSTDFSNQRRPMTDINPLIDLENFGQSAWLDHISRPLLMSGELGRLIKEDRLKGVTSNPSIFLKAIAQSDDYRPAIDTLIAKGANDAKMVYEHLAVSDIKDACDLLRPTYEESLGVDGFASLEVSPHLAHLSRETIEEARNLWHEVDRPNLMIKVPGTDEGIAAIKSLISEGINVNVTLLFSVDAYRKAAEAYLLGLKDRLGKGLPIDSVQSVASFFVSRIDTKIDHQLEHIAQNSDSQEQKNLALSLKGTIAIANAQDAYLTFLDIYQSDVAALLLTKGARPQRLLWASTGTKNQNYSDVLYVDSLIAKNTVNTMPLETLNAFREHGIAGASLLKNIDRANNKIMSLKNLGIDFKSDCRQLLDDGLKQFTDAFDQLLSGIDEKMATLKR